VRIRTSRALQNGFRIGDAYHVDPSLNTVRGPEGTTRLGPKVMLVLLCLAEHAGRMVPKDRLLHAAWADTAVTDDVLTRAISELRRLFEDDPKQPHVIETIPKAGYRLISPVTQVDARTLAAPPPSELATLEVKEQSPYPGLSSFTEQNAQNFLRSRAGGQHALGQIDRFATSCPHCAIGWGQDIACTRRARAPSSGRVVGLMVFAHGGIGSKPAETAPRCGLGLVVSAWA
jgi:DNA-binding winged helix-turn-helix (wHTH) protein